MERITRWLSKAPPTLGAEKVAVELVTLNEHLPHFQPWPARKPRCYISWTFLLTSGKPVTFGDFILLICVSLRMVERLGKV